MPIVADQRKTSNGSAPKATQSTSTISAIAGMSTRGRPVRGAPAAGRARRATPGRTPSRHSAYRMRVAPTAQASAQPNALIAVPSVTTSPTQSAT